MNDRVQPTRQRKQNHTIDLFPHLESCIPPQRHELMSKARAQKIKVIVFDVDGVLTDGTLWFFPAPKQSGEPAVSAGEVRADASGYEIVTVNSFEGKGFNAHDGVGMSLARLA